MTTFPSIREALDHTVSELISKDHAYIVLIRGSREDDVNHACSIQVVPGHYVFHDGDLGLTLHLPFDPDSGQEFRHDLFLKMPGHELFHEFDLDGIPSYAFGFGKNIEMAVSTVSLVLSSVYAYSATSRFECEVHDEGRLKADDEPTAGSVEDGGEETDEDDEAEESEGDGDGAPCPICGRDFYEWGYDVCEHLLSTWDYSEECGFWAGDSGVMDGFRAAFVELIEVFEQAEPELLTSDIVKVTPPRLAGMVGACLSGLRFSGWKANEHVGSLIERSDHFAGSTPCESCSPAGSSWTTYWSSDSSACAAEVEASLSRTSSPCVRSFGRLAHRRRRPT